MSAAVWLTILAGAAMADSNPYRGLWIGQARLRYVNEVTIPLDSNNVARAPDPNVTTPTADEAQIRLILHVNGAGQVSLLKDVAVLSRSGEINPGGLRSENDISLVTDERIYGGFPPQPALRLASAVFDFGDSKATAALTAVMDAAARAATGSVFTASQDLNTTAGRLEAEAEAAAAAAPAVAGIIQTADVSAAFFGFLSTNLNPAAVDGIAGALNPVGAAQSVSNAAVRLRDRSVYGDTRGLEMVQAVVAAVLSVAEGAQKTNLAQNVAASFADTTNSYQRFIMGNLFGDMIATAAVAVATSALDPGTTNITALRTAVNQQSKVTETRAKAVLLRASPFRDTRATVAVEQVIEAIVQAGAPFIGSTSAPPSEVLAAVEDAGRATLATEVPRYALGTTAPTPDYIAFIGSDLFLDSGSLAAEAAARGAVAEKKNNTLFTLNSLLGAAREEMAVDLREALAAAARAVQTELPMVGMFGPDAGGPRGDPRFTYDIKTNANAAPLGPAALTGVIELPANHPTNPFRHRRHPDHAVGFELKRNLRFDFDGVSSAGVTRAGYGVDQVTGVFREEIHGLHKPLGPQPDTEPIGLKVEGAFELNRISFIDTLNAR